MSLESKGFLGGLNHAKEDFTDGTAKSRGAKTEQDFLRFNNALAAAHSAGIKWSSVNCRHSNHLWTIPGACGTLCP